MISFLAKRIGTAFLSFILIITATFVLMKSIPGDPFSNEQALPREIHQALRTHYGLEDSWDKQYVRYLTAAITFDFGPSFRYKNRSVNSMIADGFPVSAILGLEALVISVALGVTIGSAIAMTKKRWKDHLFMGATTLSISIPSFILATLLQYFLALKMGWLPLARWGTFWHTILPALSLAALPTAFIARLTRANLMLIMQQDYIKTAKAKGLTPMQVLIRHSLPNALVPLLPYFAQLSANILTGSFIIEKIFGIPGLGQSFVVSVQNRDYSAIMGVTIFYSMILLSFLLIADMAYRAIDPRLRVQE
jgi:oligopeptide transport system permease protein